MPVSGRHVYTFPSGAFLQMERLGRRADTRSALLETVDLFPSVVGRVRTPTAAFPLLRILPALGVFRLLGLAFQ